jgi:predicted amidophosphoribosyltransferase
VGALLQLAALAAPPRCGACGAPCSLEDPLCGRCRRQLSGSRPLIETGPPGVDLAIAAAPYEGAARGVVLGLKLGSRLALARVAAELIAAACPEEELRGAVVPVPAAPWRWRWRGFDPAEEIALGLAERGGLPYAPCLRRAHGPRQAGRARSDRLSDPPRVALAGAAPPEVLLVDDVRTTGATLAACAAALRADRCRRVLALTLAHAC